jgi:hypothetical protein
MHRTGIAVLNEGLEADQLIQQPRFFVRAVSQTIWVSSGSHPAFFNQNSLARNAIAVSKYQNLMPGFTNTHA